MTKTIQDAIKSEIIKSVECPYGKPTDIIGFGEVGKNIANAICLIVGKKEICFYDEIIKNDSTYHYLDFVDMLAKTEIMIFATDLSKKCYKFLKKINKDARIFLPSNLAATIQALTENGYKRNLVIVEI